MNVFDCIDEYPFLIIDDNKCSDNCNSKNFFDNICKINNFNINSESIMIENIITDIQEGFLDELLIKVINEEKEDIIKKAENGHPLSFQEGKILAELFVSEDDALRIPGGAGSR